MDFKGKKVFVSGGAGVIGTALIKMLYGQEAVVFVGDLKPRPGDLPAEIFYRQGDLNYIREGELQKFAPDYFFHLAATFERSTETYEFWDENYHHNIRLSHYLMTCLKEVSSLKKVIFASSYLIYDQRLYQFPAKAKRPTRLKETDVIYPRNLTGMAKLSHENELGFLTEFKQAGLETVTARIYRSYGKDSRDIISRWIRSLLQGETLTVFRPEGMFDYVYAEDVAEGLVRLAESSATGVVNLGRGRARRVSEVLEVFKAHFPEMKTEEVKASIPFEASEADTSLLQAWTGWTPAREIEQTIPEIIAYEKQVQNRHGGAVLTGTNTLVTSVAAKVPLVKALRNAYERLGNEGKIVGADANPGCVAMYFVDSFWSMPRLDDLTVEELIHFCQVEKIRCIIPTRDGELLYFAEHKDRLNAVGIEVMISNRKAVETCLDKLLFYTNLGLLGFPVIETTDNINGLNSELFVVKERYGAGSCSIGLGLDREEAIKHAQQLSRPIFQPFVQGEEYSLDVYVDNNGRTKGVIVRRRELVVHGESQITITVKMPELEELGAKLAEKLSLYGHVVMQVLVDADGRFHVIECNSRFGGASTLSVAAGLDTFYWFLLESQGADLNGYPFFRSANEKRQIRYAEDRILE